MMIHILVTIAFLAILVCLGGAFFQLVKRKGNPKVLAKSLAWRSAISIALVILLIVCYSLGWIQPHGLLGAAIAS